jgi:SanA protein
MKRLRLKHIVIASTLLLSASAISIYFCNKAIEDAAVNKIFTNLNQVPTFRCGILLGANPRLKGGRVNPYYEQRIIAANLLLKSGKIKYLILSGDNGHEEYNEPRYMKDDLIKLGIDSTILYEDYAGFRTFDSMVRAKKIFGQDTLLVISQDFHNERALYIAAHEGVYARAFSAKDVSARRGRYTQWREQLARVKVFIDLYILDKEPHFLGPKIKIGS